jgi:hypothetical protein
MCGCVMVIMLVCLIDVVTGVTPMASVLKPHLGKSWCKVPSSSRVFTIQYSVDGIYILKTRPLLWLCLGKKKNENKKKTTRSV